VADPAGLAVWVLRGVPGWTREAVEQAMASAPPRTVALPRPIPVIFLYLTAAADAEGLVAFRPDVYGHDRELDRALFESERRGPGEETLQLTDKKRQLLRKHSNSTRGAACSVRKRTSRRTAAGSCPEAAAGRMAGATMATKGPPWRPST
jgi:hypothetical protein